MLTIFIEYKIDSKDQQEYLLALQNVRERLTQESIIQHQILEAIDQNNLFVETFQLSTAELYYSWKHMLSNEDPAFPWQPILPYINGGSKKFHLWAFKQVAQNASQ